jgi:2-oxoisovalerate dehydrogenase E1 component alpha subunit
MVTKENDTRHRALGLGDDRALEMYRYLLLARRLDERMWILHRQHEIAFHISGIGHEATQVGAAFALKKGYILSVSKGTTGYIRTIATSRSC